MTCTAWGQYSGPHYHPAWLFPPIYGIVMARTWAVCSAALARSMAARVGSLTCFQEPSMRQGSRATAGLSPMQSQNRGMVTSWGKTWVRVQPVR